MKERKVQQNMRKHHAQRRSNRPWILSPVIIAELLVVMIIAGVGVSFALTQNTVTPTASPWAGTASVTQSTHFSVGNYALWIDPLMANVIGVNLSITNSGGTTASIGIAAINGSATLIATNQTSHQSYSSQNYSFTLNTSVPIASLDKINIVLTEP